MPPFGNEPARLCGREREGNERGRNVDIFESTAHAVLAADGAQAQLYLRVQRAQQRAQRHTPALGIAVQAHEKLLESEAYLIIIAAAGNEFRHRRHDAVNGARKGRRAH